MRYQNITKGTFLARPNRFIAHVLVDGETVVCHVKNTGRCRELLQSGVQVVWGEADETPRKAVVLAAILGALGERPVSLIDVSSSEAPIFR